MDEIYMDGVYEVSYEPIAALTRDMKKAAKLLSPAQVRWMVDTYYSLQKSRIAAGNRMAALGKSGEPNELIQWFFGQLEGLEGLIRGVLKEYTDQSPLGRWCKSIVGINAVIAAGLMADIDITKAPTVGHIWRHAGLDPTRRWIGSEEAEGLVAQVLGRKTGAVSDADIAAVAMAAGRDLESVLRFWPRGKDGQLKPRTAENLAAALAKRPWNRRLKTLCWKIGESFVRVKGNPKDIYGKIYEQRKAYETERNERGEYAEQAAAILRTRRIGKDKPAYQYYKSGKLPPGHIHSRAKRYAVKIFLSHYHYVAYRLHCGKEPPKPYAIDRLGHADLMPAPNLHVAGLA